MTCAKREVTCFLYDKDGRPVGEGCNDVLNPQPTCPREPGEDYTKCWTICRQPAHAEVAALVDAARFGFDVRNGSAWIQGHDHACPECLRLLSEAGINDVWFSP